MRKSSHLHIAGCLAPALGLRGWRKFLFYFGSLYPDLVPTVFTNSHTYKNWSSWLGEHRGTTSPFTEGRLVHLCCDFFTHPHNETRYLTLAHARWEKLLDQAVMAESRFCHSTKITSLEELHEMYLKEAPSVSTDVLYCCLALHVLFNLNSCLQVSFA